jgi:hypothetical protein
MKPALPISILLVLSILGGCNRYDGDKVQDVTSNKAYWGSFEVGPEYVTTRNLLFDGRGLDNDFYWPLNNAIRSRVDYEHYHMNTAAYPGVTEITSGTRFKIVRIQTRGSFEYSCVEWYAQFLDGPAAGKEFSAVGLTYPDNKGAWTSVHPATATQP